MKKILTKTKILKHKLSELKREDQNIAMKDFYKDEVCFLFACGPSLADLDLNLFLEKYSNHCIATVKQSFYKFENFCDFNFFNLGNFTETKSPNTIFFGSSAVGYKNSRLNCWKKQHVDIYDLISNDRDKSKSLVYTRKFSDWKFDNRLDRPWGPGIMYETVLYHIVHMGFKKVIVCGWDYAPKNQGVRQLSHFYNKGGNSGGLSFFRNKAGDMFPEENYKIIESSDYLKEFMESNSVDLRIMSTKSHISDKFLRTSLRELINEI